MLYSTCIFVFANCQNKIKSAKFKLNHQCKTIPGMANDNKLKILKIPKWKTAVKSNKAKTENGVDRKVFHKFYTFPIMKKEKKNTHRHT